MELFQFDYIKPKALAKWKGIFIINNLKKNEIQKTTISFWQNARQILILDVCFSDVWILDIWDSTVYVIELLLMI